MSCKMSHIQGHCFLTIRFSLNMLVKSTTYWYFLLCIMLHQEPYGFGFPHSWCPVHSVRVLTATITPPGGTVFPLLSADWSSWHNLNILPFHLSLSDIYTHTQIYVLYMYVCIYMYNIYYTDIYIMCIYIYIHTDIYIIYMYYIGIYIMYMYYVYTFI